MSKTLTKVAQPKTTTTRRVLLIKLAEMTGYTVKALQRKIEDGIFVEGVHYTHSPDGRIQFDLEAYEAWVNGVSWQELKSTMERSASSSTTKGSGAGRH